MYNDQLDFLEAIFPGDIEPLIENPAGSFVEEPDAEARAMLKEVAKCSGVPFVWLRDAAGLVLNGLAGARCLWYLHGAEGSIETGLQIPHWVLQVIHHAQEVIYNDAAERSRGLTDVDYSSPTWQGTVDWHKGNFALRKHYIARRPHDKREIEQTFKVGRWLERYIKHLGPELPKVQANKWRHELKHRTKMNYLEWRVSADPIDVLTMSFHRPWTSCMKPESAYQFGPLTDMAAGPPCCSSFSQAPTCPAGAWCSVPQSITTASFLSPPARTSTVAARRGFATTSSKT